MLSGTHESLCKYSSHFNTKYKVKPSVIIGKIFIPETAMRGMNSAGFGRGFFLDRSATLQCFKLIYSLLGVAHADLAKRLVFVPSGSYVFIVQNVILSLHRIVSGFGQLGAQGLRTNQHVIYVSTVINWDNRWNKKCIYIFFPNSNNF